MRCYCKAGDTDQINNIKYVKATLRFPTTYLLSNLYEYLQPNILSDECEKSRGSLFNSNQRREKEVEQEI